MNRLCTQNGADRAELDRAAVILASPQVVLLDPRGNIEEGGGRRFCIYYSNVFKYKSIELGVIPTVVLWPIKPTTS